MYKKDITPEEKQELDEALQREVNEICTSYINSYRELETLT